MLTRPAEAKKTLDNLAEVLIQRADVRNGHGVARTLLHLERLGGQVRRGGIGLLFEAYDAVNVKVGASAVPKCAGDSVARFCKN